METTPDTSGYMIAGYAIAFLVMGLYVFSMYVRHRNLNQDLETLKIISLDAQAKACIEPGQSVQTQGKKAKISVKKKK